MKALLGFLGLMLVLSRAMANDVSAYIVNGTNVSSATTYPSFASMFFISGSSYSNYCGATMLNSQYALTAAHCIYENPSTMLNTYLIPQLLDESTYASAEKARASEFYFPSDYIDSGAVLWPNDIAVIKLESPLPSVPDYTYLLNTTIDNSFSASDTYIAIGHGQIAGNVSGGTRLQQTNLKYVSLNDCRSQYGLVTDKQICFGGAQSGGYRNSTCNGDSGGPVYIESGSQDIQIGITSFGPGSCGDASLTVTSVFTDVYDYIGWINQVINGQEVPKYYVTTVNGQRTLVSNIITANSNSDSGGGINPLILAVLVLLRLSSGFIRSSKPFMFQY